MTQQRLIVTVPPLSAPVVDPIYPFFTNGKRIIYLKNGPISSGLPTVEIWSSSVDTSSPEKIFSEETSTSVQYYWFRLSLDNRAMQYAGFSFNYGFVDLTTKQVTRNGSRNLGLYRNKDEAFATNAQGDLLLLNLITNQTTLLATNPTNGKTLIYAEPSPSGNKVALTYWKEGNGSDTSELWVLTMPGDAPVFVDSVNIDVERWSEDGSTLIYAKTYPYPDKYVLRNSTAPRLLGRGKGYIPSPDGSYVAYQERDSDALHLLSLDTSNEIVIPNFQGLATYWTR